MMSTAIDPHLIVLCISKAGQHLRATVRGADLSAQPGLKLPSGNPSNSSYAHSHIWKGGRTRGPQGFACDVAQEDQVCGSILSGAAVQGKSQRQHNCTQGDTILIVCVWIPYFCIVTLIGLFKASVHSNMIQFRPLPLMRSVSFVNLKWPARCHCCPCHLCTDKCSYGMSFCVQPIVTPLHCSCSICVTRQRQFESFSL